MYPRDPSFLKLFESHGLCKVKVHTSVSSALRISHEVFCSGGRGFSLLLAEVTAFTV